MGGVPVGVWALRTVWSGLVMIRKGSGDMNQFLGGESPSVWVGQGFELGVIPGLVVEAV